MLKPLFILSLSFLLANCATKSAEKNPDHIGVVAIFDDTMPITYLGSKSKELSADTAQWSLNQNITSEVQSGLQNAHKNSFALNVDSQFIKNSKEEAQGLKNIYLGNRYQNLEQYFAVEAEKQGAQYLLVMHPTLSESFPGYKPGYGLVCRSQKGDKGDLEAYFLMRAQLWNVKTKTLEVRTTITPQDVAFKTGKSCDEAAKITPDKLAALYKDQVLTLAKRSAELVLNRSGFKATSSQK